MSAPESSSPKINADSPLWHQLENAVTLAGKQDQIVWTVFGVFCAAEAVLLAGLFQSGGPPKGFVGPVVSAVGVVISVIWALIQRRAIGWLEFYEGPMKELQKELNIPDQFALSPSDERWKKIKGVPVRDIMFGCSIPSALVWACAFGFFMRSEPTITRKDNASPFKVGSVGEFEFQGSNSLSGTFKGTIRNMSGKWVQMEGLSTNGRALWLNMDHVVTWWPVEASPPPASK